MAKVLGKILGVIISWAIIWAIVVGIYKLITMCFGLPFSFASGTGVFLILFMVALFAGAVKGAGK